MRYCECEVPAQSLNPRRSGVCSKCGMKFDPAWLSTDLTFARFWQRIESAYPGWQNPLYEPPAEQVRLRHLSRVREQTGRKEFGLRYLSRDNLAEAREEAADFLMYVYLETLKEQRGGGEVAWDVVVSIADDLLSAFDKLDQLRHKYAGTPA